ncbi:ROK family protein [Reichenbachiella carrageenanivorans]|uniref:ROK family protein n=1 Tax=Reichenbachiella carrageenanivorans TaxID=2979869 RepID=A0ABY6D5Y7_9BACT|nr:ROK family protein [Reichenbachiella carrageenanivorans]UXX81015.1 ROK family protein [Reichenbachiella carrageenanivorans]
MKAICGIDLGGTKIEGVLLQINANTYQVLDRQRVPTEKEKGYDHIIDQIKQLIENLESTNNYKIETLGIGTPGTLDPTTQKIKNSNTTCLNGKPLKKDLEKALNVPIQMANDANCFALAEATLGIVPNQIQDPKIVFGVILGTGVGGGLVVDGQVISGRQGICGEWGHNFLDNAGYECFCGQKGCVETIISGTALEKYYAEQSGGFKKLKDILALHLAGTDPLATATIKRLLQYFGKAIAQIINLIDPEAIVLGGGVGNIDLLYTEGIEQVKKYVFNDRLDTKILKPKLGDSAGVFGAAMLVYPTKT